MVTLLDTERTRLDKWLWAARFFKTRTLAADEITGGKVQVNGQRAKPGREVRVGETILIRKEGFLHSVIVRELSEQRGPASRAALLYEETPESLEQRARQREQSRQLALSQPQYASGRPTKQDRRRLQQLMGKES